MASTRLHRLLVVVVALAGLVACTDNDVADVTSPTTAADSREADDEWATAPGTGERSCVDVEQLDPEGDGVPLGVGDPGPAVRSGEILAGPLGDLVGVGQPGDPDFRAKIYWVPLDPEIAETEELVVTVEYLGVEEVAPTELRLGGAHSGDRYFWPSSTPLPRRGAWRLTATAPGHWGCFEIQV